MRSTFFDEVGGWGTLQRVHKRFYDKVYAHPWLGRFFSGHSQQSIELRQSQFMAEKFGSERPYPGRDLELAHRRMYISQRLLELRQQLLREALEEEGLDQNCIDRWLRIDRVFWSQVRNTSLESFQSIDLKFEQPLIIPDPATGRI